MTTIPQWEEPLRLYKVARVQVISPGLGFRASGPVLSHLSMRSIKLQVYSKPLGDL